MENYSLKQYVVDAFTDKVFSGNPAAICLLDKWLSDDMMLNIANENNLSETAFILKNNNDYELRWFTPGGEIDLCGHATLASAFVLMNIVDKNLNNISFNTKSGILNVIKNNNLYEMDFPSYELKKVEITYEMQEAIGFKPLEAYIGSEFMVLIVTVLFLIIYAGIWLQNMHMKDKLVNTYVDRKTKFYELLYKRMSEKYTVAAECADKINEYIRIFPKKYKIHTALKEITGIILFFVLFMVCITFFIGLFITKSLEKYYPNNSYQAIIIIIVISGILSILAYKFFIINPLKRKNEIWYEISLFEKNVTDTLQQIIPDNDANKKTVNYPVDKTLKQPFALYFIVSILTGFFFIIWDYQMVMAKQKYLSKAYLVEDYFAELVWSR